jgi:hypothetical protein
LTSISAAFLELFVLFFAARHCRPIIGGTAAQPPPTALLTAPPGPISTTLCPALLQSAAPPPVARSPRPTRSPRAQQQLTRPPQLAARPARLHLPLAPRPWPTAPPAHANSRPLEHHHRARSAQVSPPIASACPTRARPWPPYSPPLSPAAAYACIRSSSSARASIRSPLAPPHAAPPRARKAALQPHPRLIPQPASSKSARARIGWPGSAGRISPAVPVTTLRQCRPVHPGSAAPVYFRTVCFSFVQF